MSSVHHYNSVARTAPVECRGLRSAHNKCKWLLIQRALQVMQMALDQCSVLDLACGRGGDLNKLRGCRLYTGVDTAGDALQELIRRAAEINMAVTTYHVDASAFTGVTCELVLCNFAVHYFCDTEAHCAALLDVVAACLVPGGVFCGTYERVPGSVEWGTRHHAVIGDCVDAIEWRVPWDKLRRMALARGMAQVFSIPFYMLEQESDASIYGFMLQKAQGRCSGS